MGNYLSTVYKRDLNVTPELIDDFPGCRWGRAAYGEDGGWDCQGMVVPGRGASAAFGNKRRFLRDFRKAAADAAGDREAVWVLFDEGTIWKTDRERIEEIREFLIYMDSFGKSGLYVAGTELPALPGICCRSCRSILRWK